VNSRSGQGKKRRRCGLLELLGLLLRLLGLLLWRGGWFKDADNRASPRLVAPIGDRRARRDQQRLELALMADDRVRDAFGRENVVASLLRRPRARARRRVGDNELLSWPRNFLPATSTAYRPARMSASTPSGSPRSSHSLKNALRSLFRLKTCWAVLSRAKTAAPRASSWCTRASPPCCRRRASTRRSRSTRSAGEDKKKTV